MPPALDLGVAGAVRPWPRSIPQSFSLWFPRWCLRLRVGLSPPFRPTAAFTRRALESLFWGAQGPPEKPLCLGLRPPRRGFITKALGTVRAPFVALFVPWKILPYLFPFSSPAGGRKARGLRLGAAAPAAAQLPQKR